MCTVLYTSTLEEPKAKKDRMYNLSISDKNREVFEIIDFLKDNDFNVSDSICRLVILQHEYLMKKALEGVAQEAGVSIRIHGGRTSPLLKGNIKRERPEPKLLASSQ